MTGVICIVAVCLLFIAALSPEVRERVGSMFKGSHRQAALDVALQRSVGIYAERVVATQSPDKLAVVALNKSLDAWTESMSPLFDLNEAQCAKLRDYGWKHAMKRLGSADDIAERLQSQRQNSSGRVQRMQR